MNDNASGSAAAQVETVYRAESRRVLASLIRLLGSFELAEEALHDAFMAAADQWPRAGLPDNPRAWLVSVGRFKAIDRIRRRSRLDASLSALAADLGDDAELTQMPDEETVVDDQLRLIFTCCHPALTPDAQIALTLREVCGLSTEDVARAFLVPAPTVAQRIVRAKAKIRDAGIPYEVPDSDALPGRLDLVLHVVYLLFNEGYAASAGDSLTRPDLTAEAIRLGRLLVELLPDAETIGLLALMLLHESRRAARTDAHGGMVLLPEQDRRLWNRQHITEGTALADRAMESADIGHYTIQAAIAAAHAQAQSPQETSWSKILAFYDLLLRANPSPVIALNRAVALSMRDGPLAGLGPIDDLLENGDLADYHLAHAARADLLRQLGRLSEARTAYQRALSLARLEPERQFLQSRLDALSP